jgi:hypothetical protein
MLEGDRQSPPPPGGVHLCQVSETVSCGACCGLYNRQDATRGRLAEMLVRRTERFRCTPRTADAIDAFRIEMERSDPGPRPFYDFYHCPFLGLIGVGSGRVGCLLHPLGEGNDGIDFRGLSFYGGLACREYFCPSCRSLPPAYKTMVQAACSDWYLYGLVITEDRLLSAFFGEVERRLGRPLAADAGPLGDAAVAVVAEFLALKVEWPFRGPKWKGPAHYIFKDGLHPRAAIDYARIGAGRSPHDVILQELESDVHTAAALAAAEGRIERLLRRLVESLHP